MNYRLKGKAGKYDLFHYELQRDRLTHSLFIFTTYSIIKNINVSQLSITTCFINNTYEQASVSKDEKREMLERFIQKYPLEYSMAFEIARRFNDIIDDIFPVAELPRDIRFTVYRNDTTGKPFIAMHDELGLFFLGAISKTVVQNVLSQLDTSEELQLKLEERARKLVSRSVKPGGKVCPKCQYNNDIELNYCGICGTELHRSS